MLFLSQFFYFLGNVSRKLSWSDAWGICLALLITIIYSTHRNELETASRKVGFAFFAGVASIAVSCFVAMSMDYILIIFVLGLLAGILSEIFLECLGDEDELLIWHRGQWMYLPVRMAIIGFCTVQVWVAFTPKPSAPFQLISTIGITAGAFCLSWIAEWSWKNIGVSSEH